jgi:hypothetical protein
LVVGGQELYWWISGFEQTTGKPEVKRRNQAIALGTLSS